MPDKLPRSVADMVAECYRKGITDIREILYQIPGYIVVDEGCTERYKDVLSATIAENIE